MSLHRIDTAAAHVEACDTAKEAISAAVQAVKAAAKAGDRVNPELGQPWTDMLTNFHLADLPKAAREESMTAHDAWIDAHKDEVARSRLRSGSGDIIMSP